jgi:hypothetical protein
MTTTNMASSKLTAPQLKMLEQIRDYGEFGFKPIDHNFKMKGRVCLNLVKKGLAYHYPHGGFSITEAGRTFLLENLS